MNLRYPSFAQAKQPGNLIERDIVEVVLLHDSSLRARELLNLIQNSKLHGPPCEALVLAERSPPTATTLATILRIARSKNPRACSA